MMRSWFPSWARLALVISLALLWCGVAQAQPTVSGVLKAFNPGARRLQIQRADGVVKNVVLRENASYEIYGNKVSSASFRLGMQVAVRVVGSLQDDPLEADLLTDFGSSRRYVSQSASSPYNTPTGTYATGSGAGGLTPGLPEVGGPSVLGPMGQGGNFPGSLTNPGAAGPFNNSAYPAVPQMGPGANTGAQPSPLGSPFTGQVVAGQGPGGPASGGPAANPYGAPVPNASGGAQSPYGNPSTAAMLGVEGASGTHSVSSMINGSNQDDEDEEEGGQQGLEPNANSPMGMQVVQFQGRVMQADARNRVLTVVPAGAAYPLQVSLPLSISAIHSGTGQVIPLESLRPGQGVMVHGLSNAAGIVEARQVQVTQ